MRAARRRGYANLAARLFSYLIVETCVASTAGRRTNAHMQMAFFWINRSTARDCCGLKFLEIARPRVPVSEIDRVGTANALPPAIMTRVDGMSACYRPGRTLLEGPITENNGCFRNRGDPADTRRNIRGHTVEKCS